MITNLSGDLPHEVDSWLERGEHDRAILPCLREGTDSHRYFRDDTKYTLRAQDKVLDVWANGIARTLQKGNIIQCIIIMYK